MNKAATYLTAKLTAIVAVTILLIETDADFIRLLLSALVFLCLILGDFVMSRLEHGRAVCVILLLAIAGSCIYLGADLYYPLFLASVAEICERLTEGRYFYQITMVCGVLAAIVFEVKGVQLILAAVIFICIFVSRRAYCRIERIDKLLTDAKNENAEFYRRISDNKNYMKTLRETTAMEERNRFAARIHDQLGHSISGSIILLEAAQLSIDSNPEKAKEIIRTATENLRGGVDEIRKSLREERPDRGSLGLGEIKVKLEGFRAAYHIATSLETEGNTESIPMQVWLCINENLGEALTNTLKHSKATVFQVKIQVMNKLIRAEFFNNGVSGEYIKKGLGLEAMEERTAVCGGKCMFHSDENGFSITNLFPI